MWGSSLFRSWSSTQNTIALSSVEAELYAVSKCAQRALHLKSMGEDLGIVLKPLIRSDASAALGIAYRRGLAGKSRAVLDSARESPLRRPAPQMRPAILREGLWHSWQAVHQAKGTIVLDHRAHAPSSEPSSTSRMPVIRHGSRPFCVVQTTDAAKSSPSAGD